MDKVDWTVDDPPKCEGCTNYSPDLSYSTLEDQIKWGKCAAGDAWLDTCRLMRLVGDCGTEGKLFKRKARAEGQYDFEFDPPEAMA